MRIAILGYGISGAAWSAPCGTTRDMELVAVFTRRDPASVKIHTEKVPVVALSEALNWKDKIDVMVLCGGSATDLPTQTPEYARHFTVINSLTRTPRFRHTLRRWTARQRRAATWLSSPSAGIRVSSP